MKDRHQSSQLLIIVVDCVGLQLIGEENTFVVIGWRVRTFCIKSIINRKFKGIKIVKLN